VCVKAVGAIIGQLGTPYTNDVVGENVVIFVFRALIIYFSRVSRGLTKYSLV